MTLLTRRRGISSQSVPRTTSKSHSATSTCRSMPFFSTIFKSMAIIDPLDMFSPMEPSVLMAEIEFQPVFSSIRGVRKIQDVRYRCLCQVHDRPFLLHPCSIYIALVEFYIRTIRSFAFRRLFATPSIFLVPPVRFPLLGALQTQRRLVCAASRTPSPYSKSEGRKISISSKTRWCSSIRPDRYRL